MTLKVSSVALLLVGCLFALALPAARAGESKASASASSGGNDLLGFGNFGDFSKIGDAGLGGMFKSVTDGGGAAFNDFVSNFGGATKMVTGTAVAGSGGEKREGAKENAGFLGMKEPMDFVKLMLNPMEFMGRIAKQFNLDKTQFTKAVGRGMNFGFETAMQPSMVCIKIIEKVFLPDSCKLKFVCDLGKQMTMFRDQMPKFPDSFFDGASTAKAMYDGASGRECEQAYVCGEEGPQLKKEFAGLRQKSFESEGEHGEHGEQHHGDHGQGDHGDVNEFAASHRSKVLAAPLSSARAGRRL